jgi:hypothetical protein
MEAFSCGKAGKKKGRKLFDKYTDFGWHYN